MRFSSFLSFLSFPILVVAYRQTRPGGRRYPHVFNTATTTPPRPLLPPASAAASVLLLSELGDHLWALNEQDLDVLQNELLQGMVGPLFPTLKDVKVGLPSLSTFVRQQQQQRRRRRRPVVPSFLSSLPSLYEESSSVISELETVIESTQGFLLTSPSPSTFYRSFPPSSSSSSSMRRRSVLSPDKVGPNAASSSFTFEKKKKKNISLDNIPLVLQNYHNELLSALWAGIPSTTTAPSASVSKVTAVSESPTTHTARDLGDIHIGGGGFNTSAASTTTTLVFPQQLNSSTTTVSKSSCSSNAIQESLKTLAFLSLWYAGNVLYNIENKKALNMLPIPSTVATFQMIMGIPIFILPWLVGLRSVPTLHKGLTYQGLKPFINQAFWHSLNHLSAVVALGAGAISFVHIVKAAEPAFTAFLSILYGSKPLSAPTYLSLIPVILGVSMASLKELSFTWTALTGATMSNLGSSMRGIEAKKTLSNPAAIGTHLTAPNVYALLTGCAAVMLAPAALLERTQWAPAYKSALAAGHTNRDILKHLLGSGLWYYIYNEVAFIALERLNPITHAVANTVKRVFLILTSVLVFGSQFTLTGAAGSAMAVGGTLLYSLSKQQFG